MHSSEFATSDIPNSFTESPIKRWMQPLFRFLRVESASGMVLLCCTAIALGMANSPWEPRFSEFWHIPLGFTCGTFEFFKPMHWWVNDGLMTIFFFVVGLEIKRELVAGELKDLKKAALPIVAAIGGMIAPALIYLSLQGGKSGENGWGIPMATDIAFVVGFLALFGSRVPFGLKIALLSLAIADDIGAVVVIAIFYSTSISYAALGLAALGFCAILVLNRIGVRRVSIYFVVGAAIWVAFLNSGVHPTVAGVLLGLITPATAWVGKRTFHDVIESVGNRLVRDRDGSVFHGNSPFFSLLETATRESVSPLERLEAGLHPWVAFGIMPLFALANAGVRVDLADFTHPVGLSVAAGLFFGKPLGIVLVSWLAVRAGFARLPEGVNWRVMIGAGCLAGIGFTMALFIAGLALDANLLDAGKIGTLTGSILSAILGSILLLAFLPKRAVSSNKTTAKHAEVVHVD